MTKMNVSQGCHALIILRGHWGGGGCHVTHSSHNSTYVLFYFIFIQNIPKHINYIMKYLDCHLDNDGQSSLIM